MDAEATANRQKGQNMDTVYPEDTSTELERQLYNELAHAQWWLENLAAAMGEPEFTDNMPNNWGGRGAIRAALQEAEKKHPELADFPPGTFITDGIYRGFVIERGTMKAGRRGIPVYKVNCGGDCRTLIPCNQARRI